MTVSTYFKTLVAIGLLAWGILFAPSYAQDFVPEVATSEVLADNDGQEWVWAYGTRVPSIVDGQAFLFGPDGKRLGQLSTGFWFNSLYNAKKRNEIITVETHFSRGTRGERVDIVSVYDPNSLAFKKEIIIPSKRMDSVRNDGLLNLTEDERFALVVNYTPAQSISIVDLDKGTFVEEVETPGCSVLYAAGGYDFYSICGNGAFMQIKLGADGRVIKRVRSKPLFDSVEDFLTISASRLGDTWYFASRQSNVYAIKMDGDEISLSGKWSLVSDDKRADGWMISGMKHTATHEKTGRLYALMHKGEDHSFEEPGTHVWVYDAKTMNKIQEIELDEMSMGMSISQKDHPRLYTLDYHFHIPELFVMWMFLFEGEKELSEIARQSVNAYDGLSGEHLFIADLIPVGGFVTAIQAW